MPRFTQILVPIDFSDHSRAALETAIEIAIAFGAKLHVLHCYALQPGGISPYGVVLPSQYFDDLHDAAARELESWREKVATDEIEITTSLASDDPSRTIVSTAEHLGADLIVMGTRGLSGIKHIMLGSVAERTLRLAPCAVLTVKAPESEAESDSESESK